MISKTSSSITTADQLFAIPDDGNRYELINGSLKMMSPAGAEHGKIAGRIYVRLASHVEQNELGTTYAAETGFRISDSPDTVRAPDAAFISQRRLASLESTRGYLPLAPDLVVEVISPSDSFSAVEQKAQQWIEAGCLLVLVADPENVLLRAYTGDGQVRDFHEGQTFAAKKACPGWKLDVNDAFDIE